MSEPRYSWTQPCCEPCWEQRNPGRAPTRLREPKDENCVFCGLSTESGIYVRIDPAAAPHPTLLKD